MTVPIDTGTILDRILAQTAIDLDARRSARSYADLERVAFATPVLGSLRSAIASPGIGVIAEFKRASPSRGRFAVDMEPAEVAAEYAAGGAVAMSVLTDAPFFQGSLADLTAAARIGHSQTPSLAMLRKDFVIDEYQILEARAAEADAVLLIVAALDQARLERLLAFATESGLDALVEVHDEDEMGRATAAGAFMIGINNRDLRTFAVDLATTERLARLLPANALLVSESGISDRSDVVRLGSCGVDAILVGESLVLAPDRPAAIRMLLDDSSPA